MMSSRPVVEKTSSDVSDRLVRGWVIGDEPSIRARIHDGQNVVPTEAAKAAKGAGSSGGSAGATMGAPPGVGPGSGTVVSAG